MNPCRHWVISSVGLSTVVARTRRSERLTVSASNSACAMVNSPLATTTTVHEARTSVVKLIGGLLPNRHPVQSSVQPPWPVGATMHCACLDLWHPTIQRLTVFTVTLFRHKSTPGIGFMHFEPLGHIYLLPRPQWTADGYVRHGRAPLGF